MSAVPTLSALVLPDRHPTSAFLDDVRDAEQAGVDTVWTYDHLTWPRLADGPWYGSVPLLAAAAGVTSRVRLGMQVATPNFRHPVPFAKEVMTLDQLSGGRLEVGLGAGSEGPDASVLGEPPRSRGNARTDSSNGSVCSISSTRPGDDRPRRALLRDRRPPDPGMCADASGSVHRGCGRATRLRGRHRAWAVVGDLRGLGRRRILR